MLHSKYRTFNPALCETLSIAERDSKFCVGDVCVPQFSRERGTTKNQEIAKLAVQVVEARKANKPVILFIGGHTIKHGLHPLVQDWIDQGTITHLAGSGAVALHDFELSTFGETSEDVARYIKEGYFGMWYETARLNDIARTAARYGLGFGEAIGWYLSETCEDGLLSKAYRCNVAATIHPLIGAEVYHQHANFDGAALGKAAYQDFLIFTNAVSNMYGGGVFINAGSATTGVEVFLKSLSMARNVARQQGASISNIVTAVMDLAPVPKDWQREAIPPEDDYWYYFRPVKTLLRRAVGEEGTSFYIQGDLRETLPELWHEIKFRSSHEE